MLVLTFVKIQNITVEKVIKICIPVVIPLFIIGRNIFIVAYLSKYKDFIACFPLLNQLRYVFRYGEFGQLWRLIFYLFIYTGSIIAIVAGCKLKKIENVE